MKQLAIRVSFAFVAEHVGRMAATRALGLGVHLPIGGRATGLRR
jgi:hypothetical protein